MEKIKELQRLGSSLSVLYVEDYDLLRTNLQEYFEKFFAEVVVAEDGLIAWEKYQEKSFDLVVTDIQMPNMNGIELVRNILSINEAQEIIIVSAHSDSNLLLECISLGVSGYIMKPIEHQQIADVLYKSVEKIKKFQESSLYIESLKTSVKESSHLTDSLQEERTQNYEKTIKSLIVMLEERDTYTAGHSQRVADYSLALATEMGYSKQECSRVYEAGILHDIGKISTPDSVLLRPGKLNDLEYTLIKEHVTASRKILSEIPMYASLVDIVAAHHEHYDGTGYPEGLKENEIPPLAHIMIVADAFDAMTTNRIYKGRQTVSESLEELQRCSGSQFHPDVVKAAQKVFAHIELSKNTTQFPITPKEKERFSYFFKDQLTGLYNKEYLNLIWNHKKDFPKYTKLTILTLVNLSTYNLNYGWEKGDTILKNFALMLKKHCDCEVFHVLGDDFLLLSTNENLCPNIEALCQSFDENIQVDIHVMDLESEEILNSNQLMHVVKNHKTLKFGLS